jgi:TetR/AcrR family transcriptional repressor of nem operon
MSSSCYIYTMPVQKVNKEEVVREALKLFRSRGYHKTTMADIGKACNLLKGSIYHYFPSKEDLMIAVLVYLRAYYKEHVFSVAYNDDRSPRARLRELSEFSQEIFIKGEGACLMGNIAMETIDVVPEFHPTIKAFFDDWVDALAHIFCTCYSPKAAQFFARESVCAIEGAAMMMRIYKDPDFVKKAHQMIMKKFEDATKEALIQQDT